MKLEDFKEEGLVTSDSKSGRDSTYPEKIASRVLGFLWPPRDEVRGPIIVTDDNEMLPVANPKLAVLLKMCAKCQIHYPINEGKIRFGKTGWICDSCYETIFEAALRGSGQLTPPIRLKSNWKDSHLGAVEV